MGDFDTTRLVANCECTRGSQVDSVNETSTTDSLTSLRLVMLSGGGCAAFSLISDPGLLLYQMSRARAGETGTFEAATTFKTYAGKGDVSALDDILRSRMAKISRWRRVGVVKCGHLALRQCSVIEFVW